MICSFFTTQKAWKVTSLVFFRAKKITLERNSPSQGKNSIFFEANRLREKNRSLSQKLHYLLEMKKIFNQTLSSPISMSPYGIDCQIPLMTWFPAHAFWSNTPMQFPDEELIKQVDAKKKENVAFLQRKHNWVRFDKFLDGEKRQFSKIRGPKHCPPACLTQKKMLQMILPGQIQGTSDHGIPEGRALSIGRLLNTSPLSRPCMTIQRGHSRVYYITLHMRV